MLAASPLTPALNPGPAVSYHFSPWPSSLRSSTNQPLNAGDIRGIISLFDSSAVRVLLHSSCWALGMTQGAGNSLGDILGSAPDSCLVPGQGY